MEHVDQVLTDLEGMRRALDEAMEQLASRRVDDVEVQILHPAGLGLAQARLGGQPKQVRLLTWEPKE